MSDEDEGFGDGGRVDPQCKVVVFSRAICDYQPNVHLGFSKC